MDGVENYLYEAQVSLVITGIDDKAWTAYCIDDTYFEEDKDIAFLEANHDTFMDPVLFCSSSLDRPDWSPREYFLRALNAHIERVEQEWRNVTFGVEECHKQWQHNVSKTATQHGVPFCINCMGIKGAKHNNAFDTPTISRDSIILKEIINTLSRTIKEWQIFKEGQVQYFCFSLSDSSRRQYCKYLASIDKNFKQLRDLCSNLEQEQEFFAEASSVSRTSTVNEDTDPKKLCKTAALHPPVADNQSAQNRTVQSVKPPPAINGAAFLTAVSLKAQFCQREREKF